MESGDNLTRLKAAYQAWHDSKGGNVDEWLALMSDDVHVHSVGDEKAGLEFAKGCCSREEAVGYFTGLLETWSMIHWTPQHFVADGDRIAMFGHCSWRSKATGKIVDVHVAHLWTFKGGRIVELIEIFDTAGATAAAVAD